MGPHHKTTGIYHNIQGTEQVSLRGGNGGRGRRGGSLMMMKDSLFLMISNVLGRGCGAGEGTH